MGVLREGLGCVFPLGANVRSKRFSACMFVVGVGWGATPCGGSPRPWAVAFKRSATQQNQPTVGWVKQRNPTKPGKMLGFVPQTPVRVGTPSCSAGSPTYH